MKYLVIDRNYNYSYTLSYEDKKTTYYFCSLRNAIKNFRKENDLKHKKITLIKLY